MVIDGIYVDAVAESRKKPVSKFQLQSKCG